jgi:hypothetical protein
MEHLIEFNRFRSINESVVAVTSNWFLIHDEGSFQKKEEGGYLVFNQKGNFTIVYKKKNSEEEESRLEFFVSKEASPDKKSLCQCTIISKDGKTTAKKVFDNIDAVSILEILAIFFDYSDIEKENKEEADRFILGMSKSLKALVKSEYADQLPASFKALVKYTKEGSEKSNPNIKINSESDKFKFEELITRFIEFFKKS